MCWRSTDGAILRHHGKLLDLSGFEQRELIFLEGTGSMVLDRDQPDRLRLPVARAQIAQVLERISVQADAVFRAVLFEAT
jgi:hypothetical protein